jgi:hypothetical protein
MKAPFADDFQEIGATSGEHRYSGCAIALRGEVEWSKSSRQGAD